jgi:membrane-bound metal-dependent hydrolase YbcI (DUF457 family)
MTTPNHIAGGIVFTGIFCSLWSINILATPFYIIMLLLGCVLPDIDHTKSIIGKLFFPIAFILQKKYGHRTITHSLVFLFFVAGSSIILEKNFSTNYNISYILFFSVLSHIIFDMMTITGVPLFYPFLKNPCVIPGNINYRIKTGDIKTEGIFLFMFTLIGFSLQGVFANGFWNSIDKKFEDLPHLVRLYNNNNTKIYTTIKYNEFNKIKVDSGYIVLAEKTNIILKNKNGFLKINETKPNFKIFNIKTKMLKDSLQIRELFFNNISLDSLNRLTQNFIYTAEIISTQKVYFDNKTTNKINIKNSYNSKVSKNDTIQNNQNLIYQINDLELKINNEKIKLKEEYQIRNSLVSDKEKHQNTINISTDLYEINNEKIKIIEINNKLKIQKTIFSNINLLYNQLAKIKSVKNKNSELNFSGKIVYLQE